MVTFPMTLTDPYPVFKVTAFLKSNISKTVHLKLLKNTNRKYTICRMIPLSMTLSDLLPQFKVTTFFDIEYLRNYTREP